MCDCNVISLIVWDDMFGVEIDPCLNLYIYCTNPRQHGIYLFSMIKKGKLLLASRAGIILASKCSVFCQRKLWPPSLIVMAAEGWGEREIVTKGAVDGQKYGNRGVGK